ncbi:2-dehydropantoate 2-reductase [Bradyrhizobium liaoningense]|uniref:2-dehydropantoate 2-reductase n=1 Tax=Bradyrhizobium liaoningense TaxID=43992 RepID=UPI001BAD577E|nr:2-dehydropantoate 2-reductase [Bradyrhizobium liaoningense]MBR0856114.1 2-dehydropantoate 2-reductase [Bradyrhizobium liaoningense]
MSLSEHAATSARRHIAVVGLGSIGGVIAGTLHAAGRHEVTACARRGIERLIVERPDRTIEARPRVLTDAASADIHDWVLLCTKAQDTASSAPWLQRLCGHGTRVAVLQNGIGHVERLAPFVGPATIVPTIVYYNGERLAPDRVRYRRASDYDFAVSDDANGHAFVELLEGTGMQILVSPDFKTMAWRKLLLNAVANPITALTLQRQGVFRGEDMGALVLSALEEAAAVARADGARVADDEASKLRAMLTTFPPDAGTSMYFDRLAGRRSEVDALTGAVVAAGERHQIATPLCRLLLTLMRAADAGPIPGLMENVK